MKSPVAKGVGTVSVIELEFDELKAGTNEDR
jgi:hypothetical protein